MARECRLLHQFKCEYDIKVWMIWAIRNHMVTIWGDDMSGHPTSGLIARPVSFQTLERIGALAVALDIYLMEPGGEVTWVDFLWAPGKGFDALALLKTKWVGWQRRGTEAVRMLEIEKLNKKQVEIRNGANKPALSKKQVTQNPD
jgi:hypothetical protein